jgi:hypothetical protein
MSSALWLVTAVLLSTLLTAWVTFTLTRLDRLHARVDAAQAALDAQLVRRVAALRHAAAEQSSLDAQARIRYEHIAAAALAAQGGDRQGSENEVGRAVAELSRSTSLPPAADAELREASVRVVIARRFYNDAVRDTRSLRARRMPRLLHLAGRRELPQFFDIDETLPAEHEHSPDQAATPTPHSAQSTLEPSTLEPSTPIAGSLPREGLL